MIRRTDTTRRFVFRAWFDGAELAILHEETDGWHEHGRDRLHYLANGAVLACSSSFHRSEGAPRDQESAVLYDPSGIPLIGWSSAGRAEAISVEAKARDLSPNGRTHRPGVHGGLPQARIPRPLPIPLAAADVGASCGSRQARRSRFIQSMAACGPTSRARSSGDPAADAPRSRSRIGSIHAQEASTQSRRENRRHVAAHRVEQQPLVGLGRVAAERLHVVHVHRHRAHPQIVPRNLRSERELDALVGLDAAG